MIQQATKLEQLILAILSRIAEKDGYATKTKLLKILYLIDVEYYRWHGQTFTGFDWVYDQYGPWTKEYEETLTDLIDLGKVDCQPGTRTDLETKFLTGSEKAEIDRLFEDRRDGYMVKDIVDSWASEPTGKILDYVYFETEPMVGAERGQALDFSKIQRKKRPVGHRRVWLQPWERRRDPGETQRRFQEIKLKAKKELQCLEAAPSPRYDDVYFEAMTLLDQDE